VGKEQGGCLIAPTGYNFGPLFLILFGSLDCWFVGSDADELNTGYFCSTFPLLYMCVCVCVCVCVNKVNHIAMWCDKLADFYPPTLPSIPCEKSGVCWVYSDAALDHVSSAARNNRLTKRQRFGAHRHRDIFILKN
jgi:hypothetical protein